MRWTSRSAPAAALLTLGLSAGVAAGVAACGGDSDMAPAGGMSGTGPSELVLTIKDFSFTPAILRVPKGSVVKVTNEDDALHTATADDGSFDTSELQQGESEEITLPDEGELAFHCAIHDYMQGVIRVGS